MTAVAVRKRHADQPQKPATATLSVWTPDASKKGRPDETLLWGRRFETADLPFTFLRGCLEPELVTYLLNDSCVRSLVRADVQELCPEAYRGHKAKSFHAVDTDPQQREARPVFSAGCSDIYPGSQTQTRPQIL
eukprot:Skav224361  [mRNA]  locus=scaffold5095:31849:32689:+ [translate_table: standard]